MSTVRKELLSRLAALLDRERRIAVHLRQEDGRQDVADWDDRALFAEADEVLESLDAGARAEIEQIRAALRRVDTGSYGVCARCGEPIGHQRLDALPYATLCARCAQDVEDEDDAV